MKLYYFADHTSRYTGCSGVQRVVRGLARSLLNANCDLVFVAWCPEQKTLIPLDREMLNNFAKFHGPTLADKELGLYPADSDKVVPLHEGELAPCEPGWLLIPEVTHITHHVEPPTQGIMEYAARHGLKTAFIFYDAIPLKHPEYADTELKHAEYMQQLALADLLIPISKFAADDLVSFYLNRLYFQVETLPKIAPLLLPAEVLGQERQMPTDSSNLPKLLLAVGTIEPRKNQLGLLHAFQKFCDEYPEHDAQLALIGNLHPVVAGDILKAVHENPKVQYLESVDDKTLNTYYADCDFTVFPSIEEGYGLPIVESLWFGKPCLCANFGSMAEAAEGGGCLTIDMRSVESIYLALSRILLQPDVLHTLRDEIKNRKFTTWLDYGLNVKRLLENEGAPSERISKIYYWVDHTCKYSSNSGIQRVVRGLASALQKTNIPLIPVCWDAEHEELVAPTEQDLTSLEKWNGPVKDRWVQSTPDGDENGAWLLIPELLTYQKAANIPSVSRFIPLITSYARKKNIRMAVIFFDAIPYKMAEFYSAEAQYAHAKYMSLLALFDLVLCISEQSKSDLLNYLRIHLDRLVNVEQRVKTVLLPAEFSNTERQQVRYRDSTSAPIMILSVGTLEPRKNQEALLEAFERAKTLTSIPMKLVLAGHAPFPDIAETVRSYCQNDADVVWIDSPDDKTLGDLYRDCDFTVYPSLEEGFGLPILESLWHARPCICRNAGAMLEVGKDGGCILVETADADLLAKAIVSLGTDMQLLHKLGEEAAQRTFRTWQEYGHDVLLQLADRSEWRTRDYPHEYVVPARAAFYAPILSICISTYNRAPWLAISLPLLLKQTAPYRDVIEVIVCDNTSTDETPEVIKQYRNEQGFYYFRNPENVGMLGNLRVTSQHAQGQYVWILGDDDLLLHGTVERVLKAILEHPDASLVYLNYAYTTIADAEKVGDLDRFLRSGIPIGPPGPDLFAPIYKIATLSENFFTAIYCLVFRRDHALLAYSQNTSGPPFSSLPTCVPTSYYICQHMMNEAGYWIGTPGLIVNMNVSWGKYASLWILERMPELYDLAELRGAIPGNVDCWRVHNLPGALHFLEQIYFADTENNIQHFSMGRFIARHKHLKEFRSNLRDFMKIYDKAFQQGHRYASEESSKLLAQFGLSQG